MLQHNQKAWGLPLWREREQLSSEQLGNFQKKMKIREDVGNIEEEIFGLKNMFLMWLIVNKEEGSSYEICLHDTQIYGSCGGCARGMWKTRWLGRSIWFSRMNIAIVKVFSSTSRENMVCE